MIKNTNDFIAKAKFIYGNKYDYSKVEYLNSNIEVEIICKKHGSFFKTPHQHISYRDFCPYCKIEQDNDIIITDTKNFYEKYISHKEIERLLNLTDFKLDKLLRYKNIKRILIKGKSYILKDDYEQIKSLPKNILYESFCVTPINELLTTYKISKILNIDYKTLCKLIKDKKINIQYKMYKNIKYYDEESFKIIKNYFEQNPYISPNDSNYFTECSMARYLDVSRSKLHNYLYYFEPTKEECISDRYYTKEFVDKMKEFITNHPTLRQNKIFIKGMNDICFDSKCEAIFYIYMKEHDFDINYHPTNLYYKDSEGKERRYEVDFSVNGKLIELKGKNQFDENGNPVYLGKSWKEKYDCIKENDVLLIKSSQFEKNGCLEFMTNYFKNKGYKFIRNIMKDIKEEVNRISDEDKKYMTRLKMNIKKNGKLIKCLETSEKHFSFEWTDILNCKLGINKCNKHHGKTYVYCDEDETKEYILCKIEELKNKGMDVSWFNQVN